MLLVRKNQIENIILYLIVLLPIFFITGPFLPDLVITLSAIYCLYIIISKKKIFIVDNLNIKNIYIFLFSFWVFIVFSSIVSNYTIPSLKTSLFYVRFIFFLILLNYLLNKYEKKLLRFFFYSSSFGLFFLIFDAFVQYFFGFDLFMYEKPYQRLTATFGDEQIVGSFISKFMPFYVGLLVLLEKNKNLIFFTIIISCIITFLSGERSATFYVVLYSLILLFLLNVNNKKKFLIFWLFIFAVYSSFLTFDKDLRNRHLSSFETIFDNEDKKITIFSEAHEFHYLSAYQIFLDNKFIGIGPKGYRYECGKEKYYISTMSCTTHPHNILLQFAAETGIIGLIFYFGSLIYLIINFLKAFNSYLRTKNKEYFFQISLILCIFNYVSFILPSGNFFNNWLSANLFFPLGFFIYYYCKSK